MTAQGYANVAGKRFAIGKAPNAIMRLLMSQLGFMSDLDVRAGFIGSNAKNKRIEQKTKDLELKPGKHTEVKAHQPHPAQYPTNAQLGYIHEFGSPLRNIPARPFLLRTAQQNSAFIRTELSEAVSTALGKWDATAIEKGMNRIGMRLRDQAKRNIRSQDDFKPLSQRTLAVRKARGVTRQKALIDTGEMLNAITYEVTKR